MPDAKSGATRAAEAAAADVEAGPDSEFIAVARLAEVPAGWVLKVRVGRREVALANCQGTIIALDNACTHAGGPLGDSRLRDGYLLECPWHGAAFDARTGLVRHGPARKPLPSHPVKVEAGVIMIAVAAGRGPCMSGP